MATQQEIDNLQKFILARGTQLTQALNAIHKKRGELGQDVNIDNEISIASAVAADLNNFNSLEVLSGPQVVAEIPLAKGAHVPEPFSAPKPTAAETKAADKADKDKAHK